MRSLAILFALALPLAAQPGEASPQPKNGPPPPHREGERRGGPPGMMGGSSGMLRPPAGFEKLSEEERKMMRGAFEKAWKNPEVIEARDKALRANEHVRRVLHEAMSKDDPKIAAILEKMKPPFPVDDRGFPILPQPESPEFAKIAIERLSAEMMSVAKPGKHEETLRFHERIMQTPRMKEALTQLESTPTGGRIEFFRQIRDLYRQLAGEEFARFRKAREESGDAGKPGQPKP